MMARILKPQQTRKKRSDQRYGRQTGTTPVTYESTETMVSRSVVENCSRSPVFGSRMKTPNERYVSTMFIMIIFTV
jgi:hypothetical protein